MERLLIKMFQEDRKPHVWTKRTKSTTCSRHPDCRCVCDWGLYACRTLEDLVGYMTAEDPVEQEGRSPVVALVRSADHAPAWWVAWERSLTWRTPTMVLERLLVPERTNKNVAATVSAWFGVPVDRMLPYATSPECYVELAVRAEAAGLSNIWREPERELAGGVPAWPGEIGRGTPRKPPTGLRRAIDERAAGSETWGLMNFVSPVKTAADLAGPRRVLSPYPAP